MRKAGYEDLTDLESRRFEIFKQACKYMDEGNWWEAMKKFRDFTSFCWIMFLNERGKELDE